MLMYSFNIDIFIRYCINSEAKQNYRMSSRMNEVERLYEVKETL